MTDEMSTGPAAPAPGPGADLAPTAPPGSVSVVVGERRTRVVLEGEIDADLGADLLDASADAEEGGLPIEVDVERVTFMDSTGIAFLARLASRSSETLRLIRPPALVKFLIEVTSISQVLHVVEGDDDGPGTDGPGSDGPGSGPDDEGPDDLVA